jgi:hypothetical protein
MKLVFFMAIMMWLLGSIPTASSLFAQGYDGVPYYGVYSTYSYGAHRFYDVNDRFNHSSY